MLTYKDIFIKKIEQYKNIAIFFHELPDMDALGSAYALRSFLQYKYPEKNIKIIGVDILDPVFSENLFSFDRTHVYNNFLCESIGIILDTSTSSRIWSQRQNFCQELFRIDHHPKTESMADYEWVDDTYPATCQMIAELIFSWDKNCITTNICNYLYAGLLTDTNRFLYNNVKPSTYEITAKIMEYGCDRDKIHKIIYSKTLNNALFSSYILKHAHFDEQIGIVWVKIPKNSFDRFGIKLRISMVHVLNNFKNIEIWVSFYYDNIFKKWKGSIRSNSIQINNIASKYNGGGHKFAAGFTINKKSDFRNIIKDLKKTLINKNKNSLKNEILE